MARFTVNATRSDPYKGFNFRLKWDGRYVAGISEVSGLTRTTDVVEYRDGADPSDKRLLPGVSRFEPITLQRGYFYDDAFESWMNSVSSGSPTKKFRKDVRLEIMNEAGQVVLAYTIFRCWPSKYTAVPELDSESMVFAFESITLENEGWERDKSVPEPSGPVGKRQTRSKPRS